jgi:hypothetical protein
LPVAQHNECARKRRACHLSDRFFPFVGERPSYQGLSARHGQMPEESIPPDGTKFIDRGPRSAGRRTLREFRSQAYEGSGTAAIGATRQAPFRPSDITGYVYLRLHQRHHKNALKIG